MKKKCIIFGASLYGNRAYGILDEKYEIIGFADNDSKKWGKEFCGKTVYRPEELKDMEDIQVIIASQYYSAINSQLHSMGIKNIRVFYYCGNVQHDSMEKKEYKLYSLSDKKIFDTCIFDKNLAGKINSDFSENYRMKDVADKKRVLFCAYIFPPLAGSGVQRSLKFVKYLKESGYEPVVLTVGEHNHEIEEDFSLFSEIDGVRIVRIDNTKFLPEALSEEEQQEIFNLYAGVVQSEEWINDYKEIIRSDGCSRLIPDNKICWVNECLKQIEKRLDLSEIDIVYTTGAPFSSYILGYYLKRKYGFKWVQDYRDPWGTNDYYNENYYRNESHTINLQQRLERELIKESDAIVVASKAYVEDFVDKYGVSREKITEITNGYDESDFRDIQIPEEKNDKFTLCFNGALYGNRTPLNLLKIINNLIEEDIVGQNEITWIFNGTIEKKWRSELEQNDKFNIVQYNGYLNHLQSIQEAIKADMLILYGLEGRGVQNGVSAGYPGKVFEYIRMKRRILCFSSKGSILEELLTRTKTGQNFDYDDCKGISQYILDHYTLWKDGERQICGDETVIQKYSREYTTNQLVRVFDRIL